MAEKKSENAKAAAKKTAKKPNVFKRLAKYLGSCKSEIKRSHGPQRSRQQRTLALSLLW